MNAAGGHVRHLHEENRRRLTNGAAQRALRLASAACRFLQVSMPQQLLLVCQHALHTCFHTDDRRLKSRRGRHPETKLRKTTVERETDAHGRKTDPPSFLLAAPQASGPFGCLDSHNKRSTDPSWAEQSPLALRKHKRKRDGPQGQTGRTRGQGRARQPDARAAGGARGAGASDPEGVREQGTGLMVFCFVSVGALVDHLSRRRSPSSSHSLFPPNAQNAKRTIVR